jgi:hypothetical protein
MQLVKPVCNCQGGNQLKQNIFFLFLDIISAAREGRYMHGNGAQWFIVLRNEKVMIDTINGTTTPCPEYSAAEAHVDMETADNLERFLTSTQPNPTHKVEMYMGRAREMVKKAVNNNALLFTNGGQWYVKNGDYAVAVVNLAIRTQKVTIEVMDVHASWAYIRNNRPVTIDEATREYMNF